MESYGPRRSRYSRSRKGLSLSGTREPGRGAASALKPATGTRRRRSPGSSSLAGSMYLTAGPFRARRRRFGALVLAVATLAAIGGVIAWYAYTRPVPALVSVQPADATLVGFETTATGSLSVADTEPGTYSLTLARTGFETRTVDVTIERFSDNEYAFTLAPLPQPIAIAVEEPAGALCRIVPADGAPIEGEGSLDATLPAGPVTVEVSSAGFNTFTREMFLDRPASFTVRLDPEGQLVHSLGLIPCSGAPKGVVVTPDGREAWATILNGPPSIEIFDTAAGEKTGEIDLGEYGAVEIVFTHDGTRAYASQMETAKVFEIDVATRHVVREFDTESAWTKVVALSPDEKTLYAANWSGNDVSEIDLASGTLRRRIPTSKTPRGLYPTADGTRLYIAGFDSGELEKVDLASGDVTTVFADGGALRHLVADETRGLLFISDMAEDLVWVHNMDTGETHKFVDTDEKPNTIDLSPDGKVLFVSCRGENNAESYYIPGPEWGTVLLFDSASGKPLDAIVGGNQCTALDVSDDGRLLVFSDFLDDRLRVYEVPPYEELAVGGGGRWEAHFTELKK